jgi:drug/metabolite transporter (DMT)-like permease
MPVSQRARVVIAMLIMYVVWGTTYLAIKVGLDAKLPPTLFACSRQIIAAAIMFAIAAVRGAKLKIEPRDLRTACIAGLLLIVGGQYFTFLAEQRVPSGLSALIVALVPLWIALVESLFPDMRRPGKLGWLGLVIGFTGLGILVWPRLHGVTAGPAELIGIGTQVIGTWLWASGTIYGKRHKVAAENFVLTAYETLVAGAVLLAIGTIAGEWPRFHVDAKGFGAIAYLAIMGSVVAFTAFNYALKHLPASKVMTYAYVNPVIAVFAGAAAGRIGLVPPEPIEVATLVGMVVIVAGVALTTTAPTRPPRRPLPAAQPQPGAGQPETTPSEV